MDKFRKPSVLFGSRTVCHNWFYYLLGLVPEIPQNITDFTFHYDCIQRYAIYFNLRSFIAFNRSISLTPNTSLITSARITTQNNTACFCIVYKISTTSLYNWNHPFIMYFAKAVLLVMPSIDRHIFGENTHLFCSSVCQFVSIIPNEYIPKSLNSFAQLERRMIMVAHYSICHHFDRVWNVFLPIAFKNYYKTVQLIRQASSTHSCSKQYFRPKIHLV